MTEHIDTSNEANYNSSNSSYTAIDPIQQEQNSINRLIQQCQNDINNELIRVNKAPHVTDEGKKSVQHQNNVLKGISSLLKQVNTTLDYDAAVKSYGQLILANPLYTRGFIGVFHSKTENISKLFSGILEAQHSLNQQIIQINMKNRSDNKS